jgi:hypothetical protein
MGFSTRPLGGPKKSVALQVVTGQAKSRHSSLVVFYQLARLESPAYPLRRRFFQSYLSRPGLREKIGSPR